MQPNGGALNAGGTPGNAGGGRPPSAIRALCRTGFEERIPLLLRIADGELDEVTIPDRIKAMDVLGKYGRVAEVSLDREEQPAELPMTRERMLVILASIERFTTIERLLPHADAD